MNLNEQQQLDFINQDILNIQYIENPTEKVQLTVIHTNESLIQFIINPCKKAQEEAIKKDSFSIQYINNPDKEIQYKVIEKVNSQEVNIFIRHFLSQFTCPIALNLLLNKTKNFHYRKKIINSKFYKDDANILLEVINGK